MNYRIWGFLRSGKLRAGPDWRVGQPGSCPWRQPLGALQRHWNNRKYNADKTEFSTREIIYQQTSRSLCTRPQLFVSPILGRKSLNNIDLKGRRINLSGEATCVGPAVVVRCRLVFVCRRFGTAKEELLDSWITGRMGCFTIRWPTTSLRRAASQNMNVWYRICYQIHGSQSFFDTYQPFR